MDIKRRQQSLAELGIQNHRDQNELEECYIGRAQSVQVAKAEKDPFGFSPLT